MKNLLVEYYFWYLSVVWYLIFKKNIFKNLTRSLVGELTYVRKPSFLRVISPQLHCIKANQIEFEVPKLSSNMMVCPAKYKFFNKTIIAWFFKQKDDFKKKILKKSWSLKRFLISNHKYFLLLPGIIYIRASAMVTWISWTWWWWIEHIAILAFVKRITIACITKFKYLQCSLIFFFKKNWS